MFRLHRFHRWYESITLRITTLRTAGTLLQEQTGGNHHEDKGKVFQVHLDITNSSVN
jgi:hypothetical protein